MTYTLYHKRFSLFGAFPFGKNCLDFPSKHSTKFVFPNAKLHFFDRITPISLHFSKGIIATLLHFSKRKTNLLHNFSACRSNRMHKNNIEI
ncbi:MAG: hypothetical protein MSS40_03675 [Bacteroidales bacterium]|nr:hypothetical protein [Bacteroidales bacterium]